MVEIGSLVPQDHLLRKIDAAVDSSHLYEMVEPLYSQDDRRPSIDPVVLFKMVLIQHLYGIPSLHRTVEEVSLNVAYRWFLGCTLQEETPHFPTVSYNFQHRFTEDTIFQVFFWILDEVAEVGYLSPKAVFVDETHIKANANTKKQMKKEVPIAARHYAKELMGEVNADREAHGKKPLDDDDHRASDCNDFVLKTVVTPGNVHDSVAFDAVYDHVTTNFPQVEIIVADSAYKPLMSAKRFFMTDEFFPQPTSVLRR